MKGAYRFLITASAVAMMAWTAQATLVTFQLDMSAQESLVNFIPAEDFVCVRGSFQTPAWQVNDTLTLNGAIYTKDIEIPEGGITYKFAALRPSGDVWETLASDRAATIAGATQILPVVYFSDVQPTFLVDVEVLFSVNMQVQIATGAFNEASDWVVVRGDHDSLYNWGGARRLTLETGNPGVYSAWVLLDDVAANVPLGYKFVNLTNGDPNDPTPGWESITDPAHGNNRYFIATGEEPDVLPPPSGNGFGEIIPDLPYFSNVTPADIIINPVDVVFQVEITPLLGRLEAEGFVVDVQANSDTVFSVEDIQATGFLNIWGWGLIPPDRFMNDDGVNGDVTAGDNVYSLTYPFPAGSPRVVEYKYGANQQDIEGGFQLNHFRSIDDAQPTCILPVDCFGSVDPAYSTWPCIISAADEPGAAMPDAYSLSQNYPNPFNPTTTINFSLPVAENVKLVVFDLLGRQVSTMDFGRVNAGTHNVEFDGSAFASGVYFYRLETANFAATKKMLMLK
jgi:hypothetical protein